MITATYAQLKTSDQSVSPSTTHYETCKNFATFFYQMKQLSILFNFLIYTDLYRPSEPGLPPCIKSNFTQNFRNHRTRKMPIFTPDEHPSLSLGHNSTLTRNHKLKMAINKLDQLVLKFLTFLLTILANTICLWVHFNKSNIRV